MSHFKVSNPSRKNPQIDDAIQGASLSVRSGKMSFIQYGFLQDPGPEVEGHFDPKRVVLLVLNDSKNVQYEIEGAESTRALGPHGEDHVIILWPKSMEGPPPKALSPKHLFGYHLEDARKTGPRDWPRESFRGKDGQGQWNSALVYYDPSGSYGYYYNTGPGKCTDDYRFVLKSEELIAWVWESEADEPRHLLEDGETVKNALEAQAGGSQGEGGALPYPPG